MAYKEIIQRIEKLLFDNPNISQEKKDELLKNFDALNQELSKLDHKEKAKSIANFAHLATDESLKSKKDAELMDISFLGLKKSIRDFETSHPLLRDTIESTINLLSTIGV